LSVCLEQNSETNDPKEFKLGIRNDFVNGFGNEMSKVKVTGAVCAFFTLMSGANTNGCKVSKLGIGIPWNILEVVWFWGSKYYIFFCISCTSGFHFIILF